MDYHNLYNTSTDFREYVDRYTAHHSEGRSISKDATLDHAIVQSVGNAYAESSKRIVCEEKKGYGC